MANKKNKGEHEEVVERIRYCLQKGYGMTEIMNITGMDEAEINSIREKSERKHKQEYNDMI
jgi:F0F1-type ATP synthase beta subunit